MKKILRRIKTFWPVVLLVHSKTRKAFTPKVGAAGLFFLLIFPAIAFSETGTASWYSSEDACKYNPTKGCPTASGKSIYELEKKGILFAASWSYPLGSKVLVKNKQNSKSVMVLVTDRGPAKRLHRVIDLGKDAYRKIASLKTGVINVEVRNVSSL